MVKIHSHLHSHSLTLSQDCKGVDLRECLFQLLPPELSAAADDEQQKKTLLGGLSSCQTCSLAIVHDRNFCYLHGGKLLPFCFSDNHIFTANFTTGSQSFTEGPLINTMSRASSISFCNEFLHLVFTSFIALAPSQSRHFWQAMSRQSQQFEAAYQKMADNSLYSSSVKTRTMLWSCHLCHSLLPLGLRSFFINMVLNLVPLGLQLVVCICREEVGGQHFHLVLSICFESSIRLSLPSITLAASVAKPLGCETVP